MQFSLQDEAHFQCTMDTDDARNENPCDYGKDKLLLHVKAGENHQKNRVLVQDLDRNSRRFYY